MFINPMWQSETERIGKQHCTPLGYKLHVLADLLGFVGLLLLFGVAIYVGNSCFTGTFRARLLWLFAIPFGIAIVDTLLFRLSWALAYRRGFRYDYESNEASWIEDGEKRKYKYLSGPQPIPPLTRQPPEEP